MSPGLLEFWVFGIRARPCLAPIGATRSEQSALVLDLVGSACVTITDPTHRLFGLTVPLVQKHPLASTSVVVIRLPTGEYRRVPRAATNLTELPAEVTVAPVGVERAVGSTPAI